MIVHDFHAESVFAAPQETNAPLIVDTNAHLARSIALQRFQPIPRRRFQVLQSFRRIQDFQFSSRNAFNRPEPPYWMVVEQLFRILAAKAPDHPSNHSERRALK
jgi:hypothetical protein